MKRALVASVALALVAGLAPPAFAWTTGKVDADRRDSMASLALSPSGTPSLAWVRENTDDVFFGQWNGTRWTKVRVRGAGSSDRCYRQEAKPQLAFSPTTGEPAIVSYCVSDVVQPEPIYLTTKDDGGQWTTTHIATTEDSDQVPCLPGVTGISLVFDAGGQPVVAYGDRAGHDLHWVHWDGSEWRDEVVADYDACRPDGPVPSLALDPATDHLGLAWDPSVGRRIRYAEYDGTWSTPSTVVRSVIPRAPFLRFSPAGVAWIATSLSDQMGDTYLALAKRVGGSWSATKEEHHSNSFAAPEGIAFDGEVPSIVYRKLGSPSGRWSARLGRLNGTVWTSELITRQRYPWVSGVEIDSGGEVFVSYSEYQSATIRWAHS